MLSVKNLSFKYDTLDVLKNINCDIPQGSHFCIIGPNGCGKTTLLKNIAGLLDYKGHVTIHGQEVKSIPQKKLATTLGLMNQISEVHFPYSVWDTVALGRYAHIKGLWNRLSPKDMEYVQHCLEQVGLIDYKDKMINELSGGQLQRVFLARILTQDPDIILLDEPTNHLDLKYQIEILDFIKTWATKENKTVIGVLHDLNLVHSFADEVMLLHQGEIHALGTTKDVLTRQNLIDCYGLDIKSWMLSALEKWQ